MSAILGRIRIPRKNAGGFHVWKNVPNLYILPYRNLKEYLQAYASAAELQNSMTRWIDESIDLIWIYVDFDRFTWIYIDLDLDLGGFSLIYIDLRGFTLIYVDLHWFSLI